MGLSYIICPVFSKTLFSCVYEKDNPTRFVSLDHDNHDGAMGRGIRVHVDPDENTRNSAAIIIYKCTGKLKSVQKQQK